MQKVVGSSPIIRSLSPVREHDQVRATFGT
jgi:hypothetical protein